MSIGGQANASTILDSAKALYDDGMWPLALAVGLAGIVLPLAKILGMLAILVPLQLGRRPPLDGGRLSLGRAAAALGDDGGLPAGRDRRLREAAGPRHRPSRHRASTPSSARSSCWPPPTRASIRTRSGAGWPPQAGADVLAPRPAPSLLACEQCDQVVRADAAHLHGLRLPALRDAAPPPQAGQPQPHLGAGADRGHPLHPGQPAAGHDRDLVRQGRARHHRRAA